MTRSDDDKTLWRRIKESLPSGGERPASSPSRLGYRLAPQDEEAGGERAFRPHPEVRPKGASKGEVAAKRLSKDEELLTLSAWFDGRLEGAKRDAVEVWLAAEPQHLELALAAGEARGLAAPWPKRAEARAAALIAPARPPGRVLTATAAAVLLVALGGFELGRIGSESLAKAGGSETDLAAELGLVPDINLMETVL